MRRLLCLLVMGFAWTVGHPLLAADTSASVQSDSIQAATKDVVKPSVIKIPSAHVPGTVVVVRIDLTKMDPEVTVAQLQSLYAKLIETGELTEDQQAMIQLQWESFVSRFGRGIVPNAIISEMLATDPAAVMKDLGRATIAQIRDVFGVDQMTLFIGTEEPIDGIAPFGVAMNKAENPNVNRSLLALTLSGEFFIAEDADTMAVFPCRSYVLQRQDMAGSHSIQALTFMLRTSFGAIPKRFVETLNAPELDGMAIQCIIDPASLMMREPLPRRFSETFGNPALRAAQSIHTLSIGVDPNTLRCVVSCQTDKASSAKLAQAVLVEKFGKTLAGTPVTEADRKAFIERLLPVPERTTLTVRLEPALLDDPTVGRVCSTLVSQWCDEFVVNLEHSQSLTSCQNHLKQIMLAMHCYFDSNRCIPPVYTVDANGRPLHSWRVLLLPYMEQKALYDQIRLDEPWDSDWNSQFHNQMPDVFRCEAAVNEGADLQSETVYSLITGPDSNPLPPSDGTRGSHRDRDGLQRGLSFASFTDGLSNTMAIAERQKPVCWMQPDNADISDVTAYVAVCEKISVDDGFGTHHGDGPQDRTPIVMYDGSARNIPISLPPDILKAMMTRAGEETVSLNDYTNRQYEKMHENTYGNSLPVPAAEIVAATDAAPAADAAAPAVDDYEAVAPAVEPAPAADDYDYDDYAPAVEPAPAADDYDYDDYAPAVEPAPAADDYEAAAPAE